MFHVGLVDGLRENTDQRVSVEGRLRLGLFRVAPHTQHLEDLFLSPQRVSQWYDVVVLSVVPFADPFAHGAAAVLHHADSLLFIFGGVPPLLQ